MDRPADLPPVPLTGPALEFWDRHAGRLRRCGTLTDADLDSFAATCVLWGHMVALSGVTPGADSYREMVQLNNLSKQFHAYAKQFGLFPAARKQAKLAADPPAARDEFGL